MNSYEYRTICRDSGKVLTISLIAQGMAVSKGETVTCGSVSFFATIEIIAVPSMDSKQLQDNWSVSENLLPLFLI